MSHPLFHFLRVWMVMKTQCSLIDYKHFLVWYKVKVELSGSLCHRRVTCTHAIFKAQQEKTDWLLSCLEVHQHAWDTRLLEHWVILSNFGPFKICSRFELIFFPLTNLICALVKAPIFSFGVLLICFFWWGYHLAVMRARWIVLAPTTCLFAASISLPQSAAVNTREAVR